MIRRLSLWPLRLDEALKAVMETGPYDPSGAIRRTERRGFERGKREAIEAIARALKGHSASPAPPNASPRVKT